MSNEVLDKYGFKKIRKGGFWTVLNNYKVSGMRVQLTLKQNPRGRKRKILVYDGIISISTSSTLKLILQPGFRHSILISIIVSYLYVKIRYLFFEDS